MKHKRKPTAPATSTTVHLRIPLTLKADIAQRAEDERRTWTQMALLLLEDATRSSFPWPARPGGMPPPKRQSAT